MIKNLKKLLKRKGPLAENEVKDLLKAYGIRTTNYKLVNKPEDLENLGLKFPVALKVCSSKILHKTDVGGVKLGIQNMNELKKTFQEFRKKFPKENLLVDQMEEKGVEIIVGLVQDPTFGLSIMCGIGGIFTELYKDVTFRVIPIDRYDAEQMMEEIKGKKLLEGFRNIPANKELVADLLLKVSKIG
ncbi:MAG: acetate--CoA ligase family protein, partial [Thermoplasmatales archaeon]|nr:acetate--CoA ligase family protein [Thermoplasmatales archaeon]